MEASSPQESTRELVVGLESRDGTLEVGWNLAAVAMLGGSEPTREGLWRAEPSPAPGSALRVLSARLSDGRTIMIAGLRPGGARSHADELIAGASLDGESVAPLEAVLWSTEYDADGATRRISIEAALGEDGTLRAAGERRDAAIETAEGLERIALDIRSGGLDGVAILETVAPPR